MSKTSTNSRPLPSGKNYHFHIIYNHANSPLSAKEDNQKSLQYAKQAVKKLTKEEFDKSYYHHRDAIPGRNIFTELFRVIEESQYTLLIVTPGFIDNCWAKYAGMSAFKKLLDKKEDHKLIALVFDLEDDKVPQELCQHEVLHFTNTEDDENQWIKLKQAMVHGKIVATPEHGPVTESGDNRLHTYSNQLMTTPDGETSMSIRSLQLAGDRQGNIASGGDHTRGANSSSGQTGLIQMTESLQIDGDESVSGTADDIHPRQTTAHGTSSGLNAPRAAASGQKSEGQRPQQTHTSAAGDAEPNTKEKKLMTKQLLGQKPDALDLKKSPSPSPVAGYSMSLKASPTVSAPVLAKTVPPPSAVGKAGTTSNRTDEEKPAVKDAVHAEVANVERSTAVQVDNSLTNDDDLTCDYGGQSVNNGTASLTEQNVVVEPVEPVSSTYRSGDRSDKSGVPESEISRDDTITELKQIATASSTQAAQNAVSDRGELTTVYSDSSERPEPEGEAIAMEKELRDFLQQRGITEEVMLQLENDKISFRVRSTDTVGEIEVCPTLDIDTSATGTASLEDSSRTVCAQCSRTYTTESCLMCEQDREYQNSLLIDQQIQQPNLQSTEVSVGTSEQGIHEQQPSDTHSVETSQDLTDEIRRRRLSFFDRNSSEGNQAMVENQNSPVADTHSEDETCLEDVLQSLYKQIDTEGRKNIVNIDRYNVLEGGFRALQRKAFKETNLLSVKFSGECGVDNGGPSREFLNLSMKSLKQLNIFEGDSGAKLLAMDYKAMDAGNYQTAGKLIAYSIVHKGPLPNFMHPLLYRAITEGPNSVQPNVNDVVDYEIRQTLQEILDETVNETVKGRMNKLEDVAALCGCLPLAKMDTKDEFVKRLCHFLVIGRTALPLQRFLKGLETLNVLDSIRKHPAAFKDAFVFNKSQTVTAEKLENLFRSEIKSQEGSNHHRRETRTITMWRDFLQDLEEENLTGKFLRFVTCMESIPPLGFEPAPQLFFGHADLLPPDDRTAEFPYVNTCANTIRLPILDNYGHFKRNMKAAMDNVTTFTNE